MSQPNAGRVTWSQRPPHHHDFRLPLVLLILRLQERGSVFCISRTRGGTVTWKTPTGLLVSAFSIGERVARCFHGGPKDFMAKNRDGELQVFRRAYSHEQAAALLPHWPKPLDEGFDEWWQQSDRAALQYCGKRIDLAREAWEASRALPSDEPAEAKPPTRVEELEHELAEQRAKNETLRQLLAKVNPEALGNIALGAGLDQRRVHHGADGDHGDRAAAADGGEEDATLAPVLMTPAEHSAGAGPDVCNRIVISDLIVTGPPHVTRTGGPGAWLIKCECCGAHEDCTQVAPSCCGMCGAMVGPAVGPVVTKAQAIEALDGLALSAWPDGERVQALVRRFLLQQVWLPSSTSGALELKIDKNIILDIIDDLRERIRDLECAPELSGPPSSSSDPREVATILAWLRSGTVSENCYDDDERADAIDAGEHREWAAGRPQGLGPHRTAAESGGVIAEGRSDPTTAEGWVHRAWGQAKIGVYDKTTWKRLQLEVELATANKLPGGAAGSAPAFFFPAFFLPPQVDPPSLEAGAGAGAGAGGELPDGSQGQADLVAWRGVLEILIVDGLPRLTEEGLAELCAWLSSLVPEHSTLDPLLKEIGDMDVVPEVVEQPLITIGSETTHSLEADVRRRLEQARAAMLELDGTLAELADAREKLALICKERGHAERVEGDLPEDSVCTRCGEVVVETGFGPGDVVESECLGDHRTGRCRAGGDGECSWKDCPQNNDGEPAKTGRHCPLDDSGVE